MCVCVCVCVFQTDRVMIFALWATLFSFKTGWKKSNKNNNTQTKKLKTKF